MRKNKDTPQSQLSGSNFYSLKDLAIIREMRDFIDMPDFPCVGAKAALSQGVVTMRVYKRLSDIGTSPTLHFDLIEYIQKDLTLDDARVKSFIAIFPDSQIESETGFEAKLFNQLSSLNSEGQRLQIGWSPEVSNDPENPHFSMSVGGHPFFVVGLHPKSNRAARRAPYAAMVFNSNLQFDQLKADGRYDRLKAVIRKREMALSGSINPMLDDFGRSSEARQYSGRKVDKDWVCPIRIDPDD